MVSASVFRLEHITIYNILSIICGSKIEKVEYCTHIQHKVGQKVRLTRISSIRNLFLLVDFSTTLNRFLDQAWFGRITKMSLVHYFIFAAVQSYGGKPLKLRVVHMNFVTHVKIHIIFP